MKIRSFLALAFCLIVCSAATNFAQAGSALTLSEVMFYPSETNGEFIEIYNTSTTETIDLSTIKFKYSTSAANSFTAFIGGTNLAPGKFAVVLQGNYDYNNGAYKNSIPSNTVILKITSNSFGSSGMANTTSRDVYLLNSSGTTIDTYTYSADNNAGISDEKYLMTKDNSTANWRNSIKLNGTPGYRNSVTPVKYINDLSIRLASLTPANPVQGDSVQVKLIIKNSGVNDAGEFSIDVFQDVNADSVGQSSERIFAKSYAELFVVDSVIVLPKFYADKTGKAIIIANVTYPTDENSADNKIFVSITVGEKPVVYTDVIVNELMYTPANGEPQWFELYNRTNRQLNLKNWKISDKSTTATITTSDYFLNPGEYVVVSGDAAVSTYYPYTIKTIVKSLPSFNKTTEEDVVLKTSANVTVDSIRYVPTWGGNNGYSLERASTNGNSNDPFNWKTSTSKYKATPSLVNSATQKNIDLQVKSFVALGSYAEVGKNLQLSFIVANLGLNLASGYSVKLFRDINLNGIEDAGEQIAELPGTDLTANATASFNFSTSNFQAGSNQFIIRVDFTADEYTENNSSLLKVNGIVINEIKGDLVINEILYSSKSVTQQWIEIYNKSAKTINLKGYQVFSNGKKNKVINGDTFIYPDNYFVIARDTSVLRYNSQLTAYAISDFTTLTGKVAIQDSLNRTIDSLEYKNSWGGSSAKSLERYDPTKASTDSTNWKPSTSKYGGTPGGINSVTQKNFDLYIKSFSTTALYAEVGKNLPLSAIITNHGKSTGLSYSVKLFKDANFNGVEDPGELIVDLPGANLASDASASFNFSTDNILVGQNQFLVRVDFPNEEYFENNSSLLKISGVVLNEVKGDLVINEIMYSVKPTTQQWVEIYNKSQKVINLNGYQIYNGNTKYKVINKNIFVNPDTYFVVARDSAVFNFNSRLNNVMIANFAISSGKIAILDSLNRSIDSLEYKSTWGGTGAKSLERYDPAVSSTDSTNWKTSTGKYGGTPGGINSVTLKSNDLAVKSFSTTVSYAEVGKNVALTAVVINTGKLAAQSFTVKLFKDLNNNGIEDANELIAQLPGTNLASGASSSFSFTTSDIQAGQNQFIIHVDFTNDEFLENNSSTLKLNGIVINEVKGDLVINEIMYKPFSSESDWIEIYNKSQKQINLNQYQVSNGVNKNKIISKDYILKPSEYLVVIRDTAKFLRFGKPAKYVMATYPILPDTRSPLIILDSLNRAIDSLDYKSTWGGASGKSLERFDPAKGSTDSTNWKTSTSKFGGTPGGINSVTLKNYDLAVKSFSTTTPYAEVGKNLPLTVVVINNGKSTTQNYSVKLFKDANLNGIEEANELVADLQGANLASNASITFNFSPDNITVGQNQFIARIDFTYDEYTENNYSTLKMNGIVINEVKGDLVINEIMYRPISTESDWIEIYNTSQKQINLRGYQIGNSTIKNKIISKDLILKPAEYLVVVRDTNKFVRFTKPSKWIMATFPTLADVKSQVVIIDSLGRSIDSLEYKNTWGGASSKSLERYDASKSSTDSTNWKTSTSKLGGTPGGINSVSPKNYDLYVKSFSLTVSFTEVEKNISFLAVITNNGKSVAQSYSVKLFKDVNMNGIEEASEQIAELPGASLASGASFNFSFSTNNIQVGQNQFIARVDFNSDEFTENNTSIAKTIGVVINEVKGDLVINELMYSSRYVTQQWFEIYNKSKKIINLNGYQLLSGSKKNKVISKDVFINPDTYLIVARDSSVFNFNPQLTAAVINDFTSFAGKIALLDSLNRSIDSLEYKSSWGGAAGKSLERIDVSKSSTDSTNWKTSVNTLGATPGFVNSLSQKNNDIALTKLTFNPQSPTVGQRVRVRVDVSNPGKNDAAFKLVLSKVNKDGTKFKVEETSTLSLSKDASLTYEFTYAVESLLTKTSFEGSVNYSLDEDASNNIIAGAVAPGYPSGVVLLNEIMFSPLNGEPEWIELYNNSTYDIDLQDWSISDVLPSTIKTNIKATDYLFPKNTFLVVAKDSTIKNYHRSINGKLIISSFASLNNDADGLVVKDSRGTTIDSVSYTSKWGGDNGKSIERKLFSSSSVDQNNWASSKDIELSTPGRINSVAIKKYDLSSLTLIPNPLYPGVNDDVNVGVKIINYGTSAASNFSVKFYTKETAGFVLLAEVTALNLNAKDSTVIYSNKKIKLASSKTFMSRIIFSADEDTLNNSITGDVIPGSKPNAILITEVMYAPLTGEPDWVEFVNASNEAINLKGWAISDLLTTPTKGVLTTKDDYIQPGEYAIATPDTHSFAFVPPKKFYQTKFGSFGNTNDGVLVYDFRNLVIDSLNYKSSWGGGNGYSIERISLTKATNDSTNWITALSNNGSTPGVKNSVASAVKYAKNSLIINEIMYDPETGKAEFVEFYNSSNDSVKIGGMIITLGNKTKVKVAVQNFSVPPKQYFITASDSSIFKTFPLLKNSGQVSISSSLSLPNDGTTLVLTDLFGNALDSLSYSSSLHNKNLIVTKNKSLERVNPLLSGNEFSNWSTSVANEGSTPAKANSIYTENLSHDSKVSISPNPFSPDNDGFEDFAIINFNLPYKFSQVRIKVFDSKGRQVRTLLENHPSGANNSVIFNGLDDEGRALRIGIYILLIEISADGSNSVETIKTPIVVARKL